MPILLKIYNCGLIISKAFNKLIKEILFKETYIKKKFQKQKRR